MKIGTHLIGPGHPCYVIAELSANHAGDYGIACETMRAMKAAGADAVKVQTYTADTLTIDSNLAPFQIGGGTIWDGRTLHELYREAMMPWEWQPRLQQLARELEIDFFSSPFDSTAVDFLEQLDVPAYKVASFELVDHPLLQKIARTRRPVIVSTGMASVEEIGEALDVLKREGSGPVALLKCTSAYPAPYDSMHLRTIADMAQRFRVPVGLSDHTLGATVPVAAVALGACIVEKHFILSRAQGGPDSAFSLEPEEFGKMVMEIRAAEQSLGRVSYGGGPDETKSRVFRRSLFVVANMREGEPFTQENVRSIRPAHGLPPKHMPEILGRKARRAVPRGTPLSWDLIAD